MSFAHHHARASVSSDEEENEEESSLSFRENSRVEERIAFYDQLALQYEWSKVRITTQNAVQRQRFKRSIVEGSNVVEQILDCWPTTNMIASFLKHPTQGKTQLFRAKCNDEEAQEIFQNPRSHTNKGYHEKREINESKNASHKRGREVVVDQQQQEQEEQHHHQTRKRRRVACRWGQECRDWDCPFAHPPRCFYATRCWFQPHCWFDHTHGLCRNGMHCERPDCWFSHRHPNFYY